jgi:predicted Zn finger-like uncharacterized protein
MNNACPSCGAVYAVSSKDIGRKLKCKKCSSALIVAESGLEYDGPAGAPPTPPPLGAPEDTFAAAVAEEGDDSEEVVPRKKKGKKEKSAPREGGGGPDLKALADKAASFTAKFGGIPTILFGFGVFLVIFFTFQAKIGEAAYVRAAMKPQKLTAEMESRKKAAGTLKDNASPEDVKKAGEEQAKITKDYAKRIDEAQEDATFAKIDNRRSMYYDRWGTMIGFFFLSFGCIGYLRTEQHVVVKIVAGAILTLMMLVVFAGVGCDKTSDFMPDVPGKM